MQPVDIVVVTYNSAHVVGDLLDSLPDALNGMPARVVVVDNDSTDETVPVLRARQDCLVVKAFNFGFAAGINRGVDALDGSGPILVLNPDVQMQPLSVGPLIEALGLPGVGIAAPKVTNLDGTLALSLRREQTLPRALGLGSTKLPQFCEYITEKTDYEHAHPVDWALGAALVISRDCHIRLGGWDETYFLYSEETDLCLRARDLGLSTWYTPDAVVSHIGGASGQSPRIHAMQIVNRVRLYRRRHGPVSSSLYLALSVLSELSWLVRGHGRSALAVVALLVPPLRPPELRCSDRLLPR